MTILGFLGSPDGLALLSLLGGLIGRHHVKTRRASTQAEIDRWASTAAGAVVLAVRLAGARGLVVDSTVQIVDKAMAMFRATATGAGVTVSPAHEHRALHAIQEAIGIAGRTALEAELMALGKAADEVLERQRRASP